MGIPSSLIILGIVLVALILIFTIGLTETLPLYIKTEFDSACSEFVDNFIVRGKYTSQDLTELLAGLDKMNIVITEVRAYLSNDENNQSGLRPQPKISINKIQYRQMRCQSLIINFIQKIKNKEATHGYIFT